MIQEDGTSTISVVKEEGVVARCSHNQCCVMVAPKRNLVIVSFDDGGERVVTMSLEDAWAMRDVLPRALDEVVCPTT